MKKLTIPELKQKAKEIRIDLLKMLSKSDSGHTAGPLGLADIFTALYFYVLNHKPKKWDWEKRDRLCLSCGHVVPIRYVTMAHAGYFAKQELDTFRTFGSRLQGHPSIHDFPAMEHSSGPLAQGTSVSVGMALAARLKKQKHFVYCVVSDGEQQEGQTWEAIMMAAKEKLGNLIWIMDRNNIQIEGNTQDVMPLDSLKDKYESFHWQVIEIDGNDMSQIVQACEKAQKQTEKPTLILAHTIAGKGVPFMEGKYQWHGKTHPMNEELKQVINDLH